MMINDATYSTLAAADRKPSVKGDDAQHILQEKNVSQSRIIEENVKIKDEEKEKSHAQTAKPQENQAHTDIGQNKAYFDIDESNNVVIKIVNGDGDVLQQIPPEDYLKMVKSMKESYKPLFHKEV